MRIGLTTPHGRLCVTCPEGQPVNAEPLEPAAAVLNEPYETFITLDGKAITRKRAQEILRGMRWGAASSGEVVP
jgi:hypothetical protein